MHHGRRFIHYDSLDGSSVPARKTFTILWCLLRWDILYSSELGNCEEVEIAGHIYFRGPRGYTINLWLCCGGWRRDANPRW